MDAAEMLRRQRAARTFWHELDEPPRRAVQMRRPNETEIAGWREDLRPGSVKPQRLLEIAGDIVVDWRGFTEADLLGDDQAPADQQQAFDKKVFLEWAQDNTADVASMAARAVQEYSAWREKKDVAAKNSATS